MLKGFVDMHLMQQILMSGGRLQLQSRWQQFADCAGATTQEYV